MKSKSVLAAFLFILTPVLGLAQSVISVNIAGGNTNSPSAGGGGGEGIVTGTAGIGGLGNWNNAIGSSNVGAGLSVSGLVDSTGAATGASFSWVTNNTWSGGGANGQGGDADMMSGYIDNFHANGSINVSGLGPEFTGPGYNVLVYYNTDNVNMTAGFNVTDSSGNTDTRFGHQGAVAGNYPLAGGVDGYIISTETDPANNVAANVVQLSGFSGADFTMTGVAGTFPGGSNRARPSGVQIVALATASDDDGDGLPNAWEIQHNLDPNDNGDVDPVNGAAGDPDADTLSNLEEFNRGTDPRDDDSDDDALGDEVEDNTGTYVSPTQTGSNPNNPDSDGDTLQDGAEVEANPFVTDPNNADTDGDSLDDASEEAANPFVTDPTREDSDGDGFSDSAEINLGSDPTDENNVPNPGGGTTISVNIAGGNTNSPSGGGGGGEGIVTGTAGIGGLGNWNNAIGSSNVGTGLSVNNLVDANGVPSGASFSWVTNNTWSTSTADGQGGDVDMMSGYIDNFHANGSIVVSGLGAEFTGPGYDVLVYYQNDNDGNTAGFTATDNEANTDTRYGHQLMANNNHPLPGGVDGYVISTETDPGTTFSANVVKLTGLRGSEFTLTGNAGTGQPSIRARPNAIQIVTEGVAVDSDGDGLGDSWEIANGLDPADDGSVDINNGAAGDPDNDGSANLEEFERGTDPQSDDSDDDGLLDGVESGSGIFVSETDTGTDPLDDDSDGDGLVDGEELGTHQTDPNDDDSDDDGTDDGDELQAGTNPNDANSLPPLALPIGYWSFDDQGAGGTTADLSNGGNDGTLNGGPEVVEGPCGPGDFALKFDGIDDSVTTGVSLFTGGTEFTMSGWVKFETAQTGNRVGLFGQNDAVEFGLINPAQLQHWTNVGGALNVTVTDTSPEWMHVAITGDAAGRIAYLNGVAELTPGNSAAGASSAFPFNIGGSGIYDASGNWFTGCIDEVAVWDKALTADEIMQLATCAITPLGRPRSQVGVEITEFHRTGTGDIRISWKSRQDRQYDILSNADLSTPRLQWAEVAGAQDIQGDGSGITTAVVAMPFPETGYLVVREEGLPPLFEDDLESDTGWTAIVNDANGNTNWERGSPNGSTGPLSGADGSANAWCTNLADYGPDSDISLRSPAIDLTGVVGAELSFEAFRDGDGFGDMASVRFLRAVDQVQLGAEIPIEMTTFDANWTAQTIPVVAEAIGESIMIEFNFVSDSSPDAFSGLSIDNIVVSVP